MSVGEQAVLWSAAWVAVSALIGWLLARLPDAVTWVRAYRAAARMIADEARADRYERTGAL